MPEGTTEVAVTNGNAGTGAPAAASSGSPAAGGSGGAGAAAGGSGGASESAPVVVKQESSAVGSLERAAAKLESESASSTDKLTATGEKPAGAEAKPTAAGAVKPAAPTTGDATFHLPKDKVEYDRILGNARAKAVEQAMEPGGVLAWAKGLDGAAVRNAAQLFQEIQADPKAWAQQILAESEGGDGGGEEELVDPEPAYTSPDGKKFYDADSMKQLLLNQEKRMQKMMAPALTIAERQQKVEQFNRIRNEAAATAEEVMAELRKDPRFEPNKQLIATKLAAIPKEVRQKVGSVAALYMAYNSVLAETVIPGLKSEAEKQLQGEQERQLAASRGQVVPGGAHQSTGRKQVKDGDIAGLAVRIGEINASMSS